MSEQNQPEKKKNFQHHMAVPGKKGIIYTIARGIFWIYFHLFCFMHCTGREKLNLDAPYIVIANHTSFADPIIAAMLIRRYEVNFLGKIELAKAPVVGKLLMHLHMIPVDRHHSDMEAMRACLRVTKAGGVLGIFPEGTRHKEGIMEHVESGVALIALRSGVPMIPLYIGGQTAPVPPSGRARRRPDCDGRSACARREPRHLRGTARPHHRNLPRADGTPGGVNTKICVKSCFFALFSQTKNFFKKNCEGSRKIRRYVESI